MRDARCDAGKEKRNDGEDSKKERDEKECEKQEIDKEDANTFCAG